MRAFKALALVFLAPLFLYACSHPIEIVGQGDVTSASGNRNCYLEDFQAASTKCTKNYAVGAYQETYYAQPRDGWQFDKWENYCANAAPPNYDCAFNVSADVVGLFWGQTAPPLKAVFKTCTPGAPGCGWKQGQLLTRTQLHWNNLGGWSTTYNTVYGSTLGVLEVGILGTAGFSMRFNNIIAIQNYLVSTGTPAALNADISNPTTSSSGVFGGEVLALQLNVDFSTAGFLPGELSVSYRDITLCNMNDGSLNNQSVGDLLELANRLLGGDSTSGHVIALISPIVGELNFAFALGTPSTWAQQHLVNGNCPN
jgi:hypothetical protein